MNVNERRILSSLFAGAFLFFCTVIHAANAPEADASVVRRPLEPDVKIDLNPPADAPSVMPKARATVPTPADEKEAEPTIYLNFENVSLSSVVNYLAEQKKANIIPQPALDTQRVSLTTRTPITLKRAWEIMYTLLETCGYTCINVDGIYRIVATKDNGMEPLPFYNSQKTAISELPSSDLTIRYLYFFKNIKPDTVQNILSQMLSGGDSNLKILKDMQACIIKDKSYTVKAALKIVDELDSGGLRETIRVLTLKEADADTVQNLFKDIIGDSNKDDRLRFMATDHAQEKNYFSSATKIISDPSKNNLILLGTKEAIDRLTNFIYKYIDVPLGSADSRIHIKEIRYAKAEALQPILTSMVKVPSGGGDKSPIVAGFKFFEDVIISTDAGGGDENRPSGNRLIIASGRDDWHRLETFIDKLDKPQPQVAFEVMIIDISAQQSLKLGTQLQTKGSIGLGINRVEFDNLASVAASDPSSDGSSSGSTVAKTIGSDFMSLVGPSIGGQGNESLLTLGRPGAQSLWAVISTAFNTTNFNVISQPFLVTNNNVEASLDIKDHQRVSGGLVTEKGEPNKKQIVDIDAGTTITLTPQINYDGIVNLKIKVDESQFIPGPSPEAGPSKNTRSVSTRLSVAAGEVLVLGGMTKNDITLTEYKTPLLSSIPIIGNLFKSTKRSKNDTNLYVFIRPSVIKPTFDGAPEEYTQLKLDYAKYQMMKNDTYAHGRDPVQRWFFKPAHTSVQHTLADAREGIFRPIDEFATGKRQPRSVDIKNDPYFKVSEALKSRARKKAKKFGPKA